VAAAAVRTLSRQGFHQVFNLRGGLAAWRAEICAGARMTRLTGSSRNPCPMASTVLMYSTSWCPYCERARALLTRKGVRFEEIDIETAPEQHGEMIRRSGRYTVPQIFIGPRHIGGSDDMYELDAAAASTSCLQGQ